MVVLSTTPGCRRSSALTLAMLPPVLEGRALRRALLFASITHTFSEPSGYLVYLSLVEIVQHRERFSPDAEAELVRQFALLIQQHIATPFIGYDGDGRFSFILAGNCATPQKLQSLAQLLVDAELVLDRRAVRVSPAIGYVALSMLASLDESIRYAQAALAIAEQRNDLRPVRYDPPRRAAATHKPPWRILAVVHRLRMYGKPLTTPLQIAMTVVLGFVLPFLVYATLDRVGYDVKRLRRCSGSLHDPQRQRVLGQQVGDG